MKLHQKAGSVILSMAFLLAVMGCLVLLVLVVRDALTRPVILATSPTEDEAGVSASGPETIIFNKSMQPGSINASTLRLFDHHHQSVAINVTYDAGRHAAVLSPGSALRPASQYHLQLQAGPDGVHDSYGHPLGSPLVVNFTTGSLPPAATEQGPGGPILLLTSAGNPFSQYYAEILRNEGFNEFVSKDVAQFNEVDLRSANVVLVGDFSLSDRQITSLREWVKAGGRLIVMRPDARLAHALDLQIATSHQSGDATPTDLHDSYLAILPNTAPAAALVHETIQFHGPATYYRPANTTVYATLYQDATRSTPYPAVSSMAVGKGQVVLFAYDLARSIVYTRQGNPKWSGIERDGVIPVRSDDLFFGGSASDPQPDWVDPAKIAIPQADLQQRLLANILNQPHPAQIPLPRFWYLPRGFKAAIVMTGDDHGAGGTVKRFKHYLSLSPSNCSLDSWDCIRATSNVFVGSISAQQATTLAGQGFEIGLHVYTGCLDWPTHPVKQADGSMAPKMDRAYADALYQRQLAAFATKYPGVPAPVSNRIDCVTWGDYDTQPQVELEHGIRFDTNYYYWPAKWVQNRPGLFTGSALPMRFAKRDGSLIDIYQATTQMTDESAQTYPDTVDALLAKALGPEEFYGVFTVNMHNDRPRSAGADAVIASAMQRHVPIVTAAQMLRWLDGRNASSFQNLAWNQGLLSFTIVVGTHANEIQALVPMESSVGQLGLLTRNGKAIRYEIRTINGFGYAAFPGKPGSIQATYGPSKTDTHR